MLSNIDVIEQNQEWIEARLFPPTPKEIVEQVTRSYESSLVTAINSYDFTQTLFRAGQQPVFGSEPISYETIWAEHQGSTG